MQLAIVLTAVGLVILAACNTFGSLQRTQWQQAVPASRLDPHLRNARVVEVGAPIPAARALASASAAGVARALPVATISTPAPSPFACVTPVPAETTLGAMVERYKQPSTGLMFVTFTNKDRFDFALTWAYRLCRLGLPHFAIGALDKQTLELGTAAGAPMFAMGAHDLGNADYGWNTPRFKLMGQDKVQLLIDILRLNATAVLMDADAILVDDPSPFFAAQPEAELLVPTDFTALGAMDGGLEEVHVADHVMNIGVIYAKPSVLPFARAWREFLRENPSRWDQTVFNEMIKRGHSIRRSKEAEPQLFAKRLWRSVSSVFAPVTVGVLPIATFCSGHTWSVSKLPERAALRPLVYHTAFVFAGGHGKRHRMREHRVWYDPPDYYLPARGEVGFLTLDDREPPAELMRPPADGGDGTGIGGYSVAWHFKLVHWQLARIRSGLLLARALSRRFIMPRLVCGFDRWWAPHKGVIPNSATHIPIRECPMDHIFNVHSIPEPWLPKEYSFLENERCARTRERTRAAAAGTRACVQAPNAVAPVPACSTHRLPVETLALRRAVPYPNYASASAVLAELRTPELERMAVLQVDNVGDVYSAMRASDDAKLVQTAASFAGSAQRWVGEWCCTFVPQSPRLGGDIAYDFFADIDGHMDRYGRRRTGEWQPRFGSADIELRECTFSGPGNRTVECASRRRAP